MKKRAIVMVCIAYAIIYTIMTDSISNIIVRMFIAGAFGVIAAANIKCLGVAFGEKKEQHDSNTEM